MIDTIALIAFVPAGLVFNLTPGADMMFCLGQGLRAGPRAALAASAGISTGALVHVALAGLGLGALIQTVPGAFDVIRWVGVAYLLWLAWQTLRSGNASRSGAAPMSPARAFRTGLVVNLTNPKVILFVLAFVPQFVVPSAGPILPQFLIYGVLMGLGGFVVNGLVGVFAGGIGRRMARGSIWIDRFAATVFAGLALRLALMESR